MNWWKQILESGTKISVPQEHPGRNLPLIEVYCKVCSGQLLKASYYSWLLKWAPTHIFRRCPWASCCHPVGLSSAAGEAGRSGPRSQQHLCTQLWQQRRAPIRRVSSENRAHRSPTHMDCATSAFRVPGAMWHIATIELCSPPTCSCQAVWQIAHATGSLNTSAISVDTTQQELPASLSTSILTHSCRDEPCEIVVGVDHTCSVLEATEWTHTDNYLIFKRMNLSTHKITSFLKVACL